MGSLGPRQTSVLELLSDGKVHETNELALPMDTSFGEWPTRPYEERNMWFHRCMLRGWIEKIGKHNPARWQITHRGTITWIRGYGDGHK